MESLYATRRFMIFSVSELDKIDFDQVLETSEETMVKSLDGTKTFVKWDGMFPASVENLLTKDGPYDYDQMAQILDQPEWCDKNSQEYFIRL